MKRLKKNLDKRILKVLCLFSSKVSIFFWTFVFKIMISIKLAVHNQCGNITYV